MTGTVRSTREAVVSLEIGGSHTGLHSINVVIDTGFNGFLAIPRRLLHAWQAPLIGLGRAQLADGRQTILPLHEVHLAWDGHRRVVEANAIDTEPLAGMALLEGYELQIEVADGGLVSIDKLGRAQMKP